MHAACGIEQATVAAFDERRDDFRTARTGQPLERVMPRAIDERSVDPCVANLAGRKHHKRAAVAKPEVSRAESGAAPGGRLRSVKRIDEEARIVQLGDAFEEA